MAKRAVPFMEGTARKWFYPVCRRFLADAFHLHGVGLPVDDDGQVTGTGGAAHLGGDAVVDDGHGRRSSRGSCGRSGVHLHGSFFLRFRLLVEVFHLLREHGVNHTVFVVCGESLFRKLLAQVFHAGLDQGLPDGR